MASIALDLKDSYFHFNALRQSAKGVVRLSAYVFGDEAGAYVSYGRLRRLWEDAVLRAHGQTPTRVRGKLTAEARAAYQAVGLHLHDLRREFASQLLEASADLHDVQLFLGHANITTTSTYLRSTPVRLKRALDKLEAAGFGQYSDKESVA